MWTNLFSPERRAVERVLDGDRDAFGVIVERYFGPVQAFAYSRVNNVHDAEDIAQETFLNAYRSLPTLQNPGKLGAWLLAIAANIAKTTLAARQRHERADTAAEAEPQQQPDPARDELHELLRVHVHALDEKYRDVLVLHYFAGETTNDIATLLGISKDAAQKRLQRGRDQLGERLVAHLGEALAPFRSSDDEKRRTLKAVLALPPLPVTAHRAPAPPPPMPTGVYLGVGVVGVAVVGGLTWFNAQDSSTMIDPRVRETQSYKSAVLPDSAAIAAPDAAEPASPARSARDGFEIGGTVTNVDGEAIEGAIVRGYSVGADVPETRTGADGHFVLDGLPARAYRVRVTHEDYVGAWIPDVPPGRKDLDFILEPYPSLTVQVVDAFDGSPLRHFFYVDPGDGETREIHDAEGIVRIERVHPAKDVVIAAWADRYRSKRTTLQTEANPSGIFQLPLTRATVISGVVLSQKEIPVAEAQIHSPHIRSHPYTGKKGEFRAETREWSEPARIYAVHQKEGVGYVDFVSDPGAWEMNVEIRLQEAGALEVEFDGTMPDETRWLGTLQYADQDLTGFPVSTQSGFVGNSVRFSMDLDADGEMYFGPLLPGELEVSLNAMGAFTGYRPADLWGFDVRERVSIHAGSVTQIRFQVPEFSGRLLVTLPDWLVEEAEPRGISVLLSQDDHRLLKNYDARLHDGTGLLEHVPLGMASVAAMVYTEDATYCTTMPINVAPDSDVTLALAFDRTTGIRVVEDSLSSETPPRISVVAGPPRRDSWTPPSSERPLSFDHQIYGLVPGEYRLRYYLPTNGRRFTYESENVEWTVSVSAGEILYVKPPVP